MTNVTGKRYYCEVCGEIMAEQYAPLVKGKTMCIPCSGYES
jgi:formylmethanofuran dehydrogenase subunit E